MTVSVVAVGVIVPGGGSGGGDVGREGGGRKELICAGRKCVACESRKCNNASACGGAKIYPASY